MLEPLRIVIGHFSKWWSQWSLTTLKSLEYDMNFQSCWDLSLLLSTWFFTLPSLVYFAPIVDVHLVIFSVNHPWKHLEANVRGRRCVTLQKIFILLTLSVCVCSFWILSTQYIRYCKIPLTGVWQSHLGDRKTFHSKTVKMLFPSQKKTLWMCKLLKWKCIFSAIFCPINFQWSQGNVSGSN